MQWSKAANLFWENVWALKRALLMDKVSNSSVLEGDGAYITHKVVGHEVLGDHFPMHWLFLGCWLVGARYQQLLDATTLATSSLIIFRPIQVDVLQVWELLAHQVVQDHTARDHPSYLVWCKLNALLDDPPLLGKNTECILNDPSSSRQTICISVLAPAVGLGYSFNNQGFRANTSSPTNLWSIVDLCIWAGPVGVDAHPDELIVGIREPAGWCY